MVTPFQSTFGSATEQKPAPRFNGWKIRLALIIALLSIVGFTTYFKAFTGFSWWDDEGYLMITIHALLRGKPLYDQIYTLYGPFYYLVQWIFYTGTGVQLSHESVRFSVLALWLISAGLMAASAYRITRSLLVSGLTLFIVAKVLRFFAWEPGHPEEVCMALVAGLLLVACHISSRISIGQVIAFGLLLGALTQTKINIGIYASLALLLALLISAGEITLFVLVGGISIVCIATIMHSLFYLPWALHYFCFVALSLIGGLCVAFQVTRDSVAIDVRKWMVVLGAAFLVAWAAIVVPFWMHGTSIRAFLFVTILQHKNFTQHWFRPSEFRLRAVAWSAAASGLAYIWAFLRRPRYLIPALKAMFAIFGIWRLASPVDPAVVGLHTTMVLAPFAWLVLIEPSGARDTRFARGVVCFYAILTTLYAFPVSGSQSIFSMVPLVIVIGVCLYDTAIMCGQFAPRVFWRPSLAVATLLLLGLYVGELIRAEHLYSTLVPLELPGADRIHVEPSDAHLYQWLTSEVNQRCSSFFSMPGLYSLYFWTHQESPTTLTMNDWPAFFNADQQRAMLNELERHDTGCVVYNPESVERLSAGQDVYVGPLAQYVRSEFTPLEERWRSWKSDDSGVGWKHLEPFLIAYGHYDLLVKRKNIASEIKTSQR